MGRGPGYQYFLTQKRHYSYKSLQRDSYNDRYLPIGHEPRDGEKKDMKHVCLYRYNNKKSFGVSALKEGPIIVTLDFDGLNCCLHTKGHC